LGQSDIFSNENDSNTNRVIFVVLIRVSALPCLSRIHEGRDGAAGILPDGNGIPFLFGLLVYPCDIFSARYSFRQGIDQIWTAHSAWASHSPYSPAQKGSTQ
jgi:hypothetical protein